MKAYYFPGTSSGGSVSSITEETPSGTINGINNTFTISNAPTLLLLHRNGLLQKQGDDYNLVGTTITFLAGATPQTGDSLTAILIS